MATKKCLACASEASESAAFCPQCGSTLPADVAYVSPPQFPGQGAQRPAAVSGTSVPTFRFDANRWSTADRITGGATIALFIALFLPWFGVTAFGINATADGIEAHGFLYLVLFMAIAIVVYLVARSGWDPLPIGVSFAHSPVMFVASVFNLGLVVIAFIWKPGGSGVGWEFGSILALVAAGIAAAPTAIPAIQSRRNP